MIIELQIINRILKNKDISLLTLNNIDREYFVEYQEEIDFIFEHYDKYGKVPDEESFFEKFSDVEVIIVEEPDAYLINTIRESYVYEQTVPILNKAVEYAKDNSEKAVEYLNSKIPSLTMKTSTQGTDIMKNAPDRLEAYNNVRDRGNEARLPLPLKELNDLLCGGLLYGEELCVIQARPNQGKSWILELIGAGAYLQNIPVLYYSGEMSPNIVGYRVDSCLKNFSNTALMSGNCVKEEYNNYVDYISMISSGSVPFVVVTKKQLDGKPTVSKLAGLVEKYKAKILICDQLSLMADERRRKNESKKDEFGHIAEDLLALSEKYGIPVVLAAQSKRDASGRKSAENKVLAPFFEDIAESDQVGQAASRVISIRQTEDGGIEFCKRKDRYFGRVDESEFYNWVIDTANFTYIPSSNSNREETKFSRRKLAEVESVPF